MFSLETASNIPKTPGWELQLRAVAREKPPAIPILPRIPNKSRGRELQREWPGFDRGVTPAFPARWTPAPAALFYSIPFFVFSLENGSLKQP